MNHVSGDLIKLAKAGAFDVIVHGCNCFCIMGAGVAKQIKREFPDAYLADLATKRGDREKLGTYSSAVIDMERGRKLTVINAYTQFDWGAGGQKADIDAIKTVFQQIAQDFPDKRIGFPRIGAGLAGGDWRVISGVIAEALTQAQAKTCVTYQAAA